MDDRDARGAVPQAQNGEKPTAEEERAQDHAVVRMYRRRNAREYLAAALVVAFFALVGGFMADPWRQAGAWAIVLGTAFVAGFLAWKGTVSPPGPHEPTMAWRRAVLTQQKALLDGVVWWYLAPLVPGMALFLLGPAFSPNAPPHWLTGGVVLLGIAAFVWVARLNRRAAVGLGDALEALDAEEAGSPSSLGAGAAPPR